MTGLAWGITVHTYTTVILPPLWLPLSLWVVLRSNSNVPSYKPKLMQPSGLNSHWSSVCEKNFTTAVPNVEYRAPHSWNLSFDIERTPFTEPNLKLSPSFREEQLIHGMSLIYLQRIDLAFYSSHKRMSSWVTQTLESKNIVISLCLSVLPAFLNSAFPTLSKG